MTWAVWGSEIRWTVDDWGNSSFYTFIQLRKGVSQQEIEPKISGYLSDKPTVEGGERLSLQPLKKIHLYSNYDWDWTHGDIKYVLAFFIVGIFILLIAIGFTSCGDYSKVLNKGTAQEQYEMATNMYEAQSFNKAIQLFEKITPFYRGKPQMERIQFM